jgi:aminoglycoside phosphotransferase family enzyme/predicted kinase
MVILNQDFFNPCIAHAVDSSRLVVKAMRSPAAYLGKVSEVDYLETHISHVFLAGAFAYKIKKPIKTHFLDYTSLAKRHHCCAEEFRLNRRYAEDLYIGVVPITIVNGEVCVEGQGEPVEYAVKMKRFADGALVSQRLEVGMLTTAEVQELATTVAGIHASAEHCEMERASRVPTLLFANLLEIIEGLRKDASGEIAASLAELFCWSEEYFAKHQEIFASRSLNGFIRECHGDLHLQNIVHWNGKLVPFDGIEFNESLRWIDVMNDAAFLAMDLAARGRLDLSRLFINRYLESTGDHASLGALRWYLVYRALVRAMVAKMNAGQHENVAELKQASIKDCHDHIRLAYRFTRVDAAALYITHGLSGSGKTTVSEIVVARRGAIRLRSDVERKRHFGLSVEDPVDETLRHKIYCESANIATYNRLERLACGILRDGYPVVIDATFLKHSDRERFRKFAEDEHASFAILDCHADVPTLRQRIVDRIAEGHDASDADLHVLDLQLASQEPLTPLELKSVVTVQDLVATIDQI